MTVIQKQCLLRYLGYYTGAVDGIWGNGSRSAAEAFCREEDIREGEMEKKLQEAVCREQRDWWQNIRYFTRAEFACKCGKFCDGYPAEPVRELVELVDGARAHFGRAGIVVSGLRCATHNANVGGAAQSRHMSGRAVDLQIRGVSADELLEYIRKQPGVRYAYKINGTNVHFDVT